MALISYITCSVCQQEKTVSHSASDWPPEVCDECVEKKKEQDKEVYLAWCASLPIEERLVKIETALYDLERKPPPFDSNTLIG